jgi:hypothetical protein
MTKTKAKNAPDRNQNGKISISRVNQANRQRLDMPAMTLRGARKRKNQLSGQWQLYEADEPEQELNEAGQYLGADLQNEDIETEARHDGHSRFQRRHD